MRLRWISLIYSRPPHVCKYKKSSLVLIISFIWKEFQSATSGFGANGIFPALSLYYKQDLDDNQQKLTLRRIDSWAFISWRVLETFQSEEQRKEPLKLRDNISDKCKSDQLFMWEYIQSPVNQQDTARWQLAHTFVTLSILSMLGEVEEESSCVILWYRVTDHSDKVKHLLHSCFYSLSLPL